MKSAIFILIMGLATLSISGGPFKVEHKGALKNLMHKGDLSSKADLSDFKDHAHLYALGAIENLKGEVLIMDSKPFLSSVVDKQMVIDNTFEKKATLLVYVSVDEWSSGKIPKSISSYEKLEKYVEKMAKKGGINTEEPFPFLIEGKIKAGDWHVIDWLDGDTEHTHEKHIKSGLYGSIADQEVSILGFWSNKHHAIFTHHTTNMHLHFKTADDKLAGHLDGLTLGKGMILKLPKVD